MDKSKARQGCWTCKERKIGCDRSLPACVNCSRSGRRCGGYAVRLQWADKSDGRRKTAVITPKTELLRNGQPRESLETRGREYHFLNTSLYDIKVASSDGRVLSATLQLNTPTRPPRTLSPFPKLHHADASYLSYYEQQIACMISTTKVRNGFRTCLLPMAMASPFEEALGLRDAMLAVASFHSAGRSAALPYKTRAVRLLARSLSAKTAGNVICATLQTQLATCMMLCVYDVFDNQEGKWNMHMNGARQLFRALNRLGGERPGNDFLMTWFLYHDVFGRLAQTSRFDDEDISQDYSNTADDHQLIIGSIGCSVEMLGLINDINRARILASKLPCHTAVERDDLERRLLRLKQHDGTVDPRDGCSSDQTAATAELYHLAGLLYLHQVLPLPGDPCRRSELMDAAFNLLQSMNICTSPWPLFTIACGASKDDQRMALLVMLDRMDESRNIGNVFGLRKIIEHIWKQTDLRSRPLQWWSIFSLESAVPWFI